MNSKGGFFWRLLFRFSNICCKIFNLGCRILRLCCILIKPCYVFLPSRLNFRFIFWVFRKFWSHWSPRLFWRAEHRSSRRVRRLGQTAKTPVRLCQESIKASGSDSSNFLLSVFLSFFLSFFLSSIRSLFLSGWLSFCLSLSSFVFAAF